MQRRADALEVLQKLRDNLADRMSERILDTAEDLLDDALGDSFRGEIELLYEQYGAKLVLINQMIGNFPGDPYVPPPPQIFTENHASESSSDTSFEIPLHLAPQPEGEVGGSDASPGGSIFHRHEAHHPESTWDQFLRQIRCRDIIAAGQAFALMSALPSERAELAASHFLMRCDRDSGFFEHATQLVEDVRLAGVNDALEILYGSFGLEGDDALATLVALRPFLARELSTSQDLWE
jgi:hypothetical protein